VHRSFLNHSGAINDLKILPTSTVELTHFVTGSTDKTVRIWNIFHAPPK